MARFLALLCLLFASPGHADTIANPSLWHIKSGKSEVYLLGSIHMLPPDVAWRSPAIAAALKRADVFVFEVSEDARSMDRLKSLVAARGALPQGQTLRALIAPGKRANFDAALKASGVPEEAVAHDRPWLAGLVMLMAQASRQSFDPASGVDVALMAQARQRHKPLRYLETIDQQLAVLAPDDPGLELEEFESGLDDLKDVSAGIQPLVAAWSAGDQKTLDTLVNGDLNDSPAARKALLDDRNARWLPQIQAMLRQRHVFFITVGAGHLTGAKGLPALLRQAGYKVEGP